jgi:hypothetical protein
LNSWLGGFESILKRMTAGNFDWFLHAMLVYHTKVIIQRQNKKQSGRNEEEDTDSGSEDI